MSHNQTMSDKKQLPLEPSCNEMTQFFVRKSRGDAGPFHMTQPRITALLAKHQQPHKFPASGFAGASAQ
jgi:hypothetical protein